MSCDEPTTTTSYGKQIWKDENEENHREDGPAVVYADGSKEWFIHGKRHREDGPAVIHYDGSEEWWLDGKLHREDGPAYIDTDTGDIEYWFRGKPHREDGPAKICVDGTKEWIIHGKLHRVDGPALEYANVGTDWYFNDVNVSSTFLPWAKEFGLDVNNLSKEDIALIKLYWEK